MNEHAIYEAVGSQKRRYVLTLYVLCPRINISWLGVDRRPQGYASSTAPRSSTSWKRCGRRKRGTGQRSSALWRSLTDCLRSTNPVLIPTSHIFLVHTCRPSFSYAPYYNPRIIHLRFAFSYRSCCILSLSYRFTLCSDLALMTGDGRSSHTASFVLCHRLRWRWPGGQRHFSLFWFGARRCISAGLCGSLIPFFVSLVLSFACSFLVLLTFDFFSAAQLIMCIVVHKQQSYLHFSQLANTIFE